ncbi:MAG: alpha/beta fold hydrolase [Polyangiales bacterium]
MTAKCTTMPRRAMPRPRQLVTATLLACVSAVAAGCFGGPDTPMIMRSPTPPMRVIEHAPLGPERARGLVVFLPAFAAGLRPFEQHEFVEQAQRHRYDVVLADAHFGFYRYLSLVPRLAEDVIVPAEVAGYDRIWLVGASLGGIGSLVYAQARPEDIDGVLLVGPFLGPPRVSEEIREAGGLDAWDPGPMPVDDDILSLTRRAWAFLKKQPSDDLPPVYLLYGEADPNVSSQELLAEHLPDDRVIHGPGGHKWHIWAPMFARLTDRALGDPPTERVAHGAAAR